VRSPLEKKEKKKKKKKKKRLKICGISPKCKRRTHQQRPPSVPGAFQWPSSLAPWSPCLRIEEMFRKKKRKRKRKRKRK